MFAWVDKEKYDESKIAYRCKINGREIRKANCIKPQTNTVKTSHILFVTSLHRLYAYISITTLYETIIFIRDNRKLLKENAMHPYLQNLKKTHWKTLFYSCKVLYNFTVYNQKSGTWKTTNPFREIVRDSDSQRR